MSSLVENDSMISKKRSKNEKKLLTDGSEKPTWGYNVGKFKL